EKGRRASGSAAPSFNNVSGDEDICHMYIVPKPAPPPSPTILSLPVKQLAPTSYRPQDMLTVLEREKNGKGLSSCTDEAAMHLEHP
ncbi:hypothetical protein PAXRUDRAFT_124750, partial [Paxillus rubicundulus Ve08.2h10]